MKEFFAVEGMTLEFEDPAHTGEITITGLPSEKVKAEGSKVYQNGTAITIANGSDGEITAATGAGTLIATSIKNTVEGIAPLREGDVSIPITMTGTNPNPPPPAMSYVTIVKISSAGQEKTKGE